MGDSTPKDPYGNSIDETIVFYVGNTPLYSKVDPQEKIRKAEAEQKKKAEQEAQRLEALQADKPWLRDNFAYEPHTAEVLAQTTAYNELGLVFTEFNKASKESANLYSDEEAVKSRADFKLLMQDKAENTVSMFGTNKPHLNRYVGEKLQKFENVFNKRTDQITKKRLHSAVNTQFEITTGQYLDALQDPDTEPEVLEAAKEALEYTCTAQGKYNFEPAEKYQQRIKQTLEKAERKRNVSIIRRLCETETTEPSIALTKVEPLLLEEMLTLKTGKRATLNKDVATVMDAVSAQLGLNPLEAGVVKLSYAMQQKAANKQAQAIPDKQPLVDGTQETQHTKKAVVGAAIQPQQINTSAEVPTEQSIAAFAQQTQQQMQTALAKAQEKVDVCNAARVRSGTAKAPYRLSVMEKLEAMQQVLLQNSAQSETPNNVYYVASANTGVVSDVPMPLQDGEGQQAKAQQTETQELANQQGAATSPEPDALTQALTELKAQAEPKQPWKKDSTTLEVRAELSALKTLVTQLNDKAIIAENQEAQDIAVYLLREGLKMEDVKIADSDFLENILNEEHKNIHIPEHLQNEVETKVKEMQIVYNTDIANFFASYIQSPAIRGNKYLGWLDTRLVDNWRKYNEPHPEIEQLRGYAEEQIRLQDQYGVYVDDQVLFPKQALNNFVNQYEYALKNNKLEGFVGNLKNIQEVLGEDCWKMFSKNMLQTEHGKQLNTLLTGMHLQIPTEDLLAMEKLSFSGVLHKGSSEPLFKYSTLFGDIPIPVGAKTMGIKEISDETMIHLAPFLHSLRGGVYEKDVIKNITSCMILYTAAKYKEQGSADAAGVAKFVVNSVFKDKYFIVELNPGFMESMYGKHPPTTNKLLQQGAVLVNESLDALPIAATGRGRSVKPLEAVQAENGFPNRPVAVPVTVNGRLVDKEVAALGFAVATDEVDYSTITAPTEKMKLLLKEKQVTWHPVAGNKYQLCINGVALKYKNGTVVEYSLQDIEQKGIQQRQNIKQADMEFYHMR